MVQVFGEPCSGAPSTPTRALTAHVENELAERGSSEYQQIVNDMHSAFVETLNMGEESCSSLGRRVLV